MIILITPGKLPDVGVLQNKKSGLRTAIKRTTLQAERRIKEAQSGPKSGRVYTNYFFTDKSGRLRKGKKRPRKHQASAPGEAPAVDTGFLRRSITSQIQGLTGVVSVGANYGIYLELGTARIAPRPFVAPVAAAIKPILLNEVALALKG